ncbi:Pol Polyprotein [Phytophthora megakarya]|uniref:Pol Polyprotein n=1 Tax=Phytophthora megakarya TaxID=4795 RepID=A0A225UV03_9STRA|nr:Pol Polyprotein [Phytophthora megakarya]
MQEKHILACYSRTLTEHQKNYTTMELELLSIVELLAEYRTMLLGFPIVVHMDHKNLIFPTEKTYYRLSMEYIKGNKNVGAVAFSRMRFETKEQATVVEEMYLANNNPECVMHGPVLREHQQNDKMIQQIHTACLAGTNNPDYRLLPLLGCMLVAYQQRIVVPGSLRDDLMDWYHQNLCHPGGTRQYKTMRQIFYWSGMDTMITKFCHKCQTCKRAKVRGEEKPPPRTLKTVDPSDIVHIDLIGPYDDGSYGVTMIDQATRWLEIGIQADRQALTTAETFDREWLCRYPRPREVVYDNGKEFIGEEFQELLRSYG